MQCHFHPERAAASACEACGKGLCEACATAVLGSTFCSDCLAQRLRPSPPAPPPPAFRLKRPWLAGLLSVMPGLGQVYNGFVVRGLAQFTTFFFVVWLVDVDGAPQPLLGLAMAVLYVWQVVDAVHSAREINALGRLPDPEEARAFGRLPIPGVRPTRRTAGIALMVLGSLVILGRIAASDIVLRWVIPLALVGAGAWLVFRVKSEEGAVRKALGRDQAAAPPPASGEAGDQGRVG